MEPTAIGSIPHDGWFGPKGLVRGPWADSRRTLVVAGCALALLACKALIVSGMTLRCGARLAAGRLSEAGDYARVALDTLSEWPARGTSKAC